MAKEKRPPQRKSGGIHWSDGGWLIVALVALGGYAFLGVQAALIGAIVAAFVLLGAQNLMQVRKEDAKRHKDSDGFWNPHQ
jgi:hypothetical protein